jgi:RNA 3'-terminal phosphate cyclase-like protein
MSWFVEGVLPLAAFAKEPLQLTLSGLTNDTLDVSVDTLRAVTLPLLTHVGIEGAAIKVGPSSGATPSPVLPSPPRSTCTSTRASRLITTRPSPCATGQVKKRGLPPGGGGLVEFSCPIVRELRPLNLVEPGLIKRVRGVAYCAKVRLACSRPCRDSD